MVKLVPAFLRGALPADGAPAANGPAVGADVDDATAPAWLACWATGGCEFHPAPDAMVKLVPAFLRGALPADGAPAANGPAVGADVGAAAAPAWLACWATGGCEAQPLSMVKAVPAFLRGAFPDPDGPAGNGPAIGADVDGGASAWLETGLFLSLTIHMAKNGKLRMRLMS